MSETINRVSTLTTKYEQIPYNAMFQVVHQLSRKIYWNELQQKISRKKYGDAFAHFLKGTDFSKAIDFAENYNLTDDARHLLTSIQNPSDTYILQNRTRDIGELVNVMVGKENNYRLKLVNSNIL